jgi:hypothetical protein
MRQVTVTADIGNAAELETFSTVPVILDQYLTPFQVTYSLNSGSTGTVKVTTTDPYPKVDQDFVEADFDWVDVPTTAPNATGFLGQPFRAIYLTGAAQGDTLTVIQSGVK